MMLVGVQECDYNMITTDFIVIYMIEMLYTLYVIYRHTLIS